MRIFVFSSKMTLLKVLCLLAACVSLSACRSAGREDVVPSADFAPYVSAYTGGIVSRASAVRIELAEELPMVDLNDRPDDLFEFSPSVEGEARWVSNSVIEFIPDAGELQPGLLYEGLFRLGRLIAVDKDLQDFRFSFRVQQSDFSLQTDAVTIVDGTADEVTLTGALCFSDVSTVEVARQVLKAFGPAGRPQPLTVVAGDGASRYAFSVQGIPRSDEDYELMLVADGTEVGIDRKVERRILIPAKNSFRFLSATRMTQPDNGIEVVFSLPVSDVQDLKGLVEVPELPFVTQVKNNKIYVYFESDETRNVTLKIHEGLQSADGKKLDKPQTLSFGEQNVKPQVQIAAEAAILPDAAHLVLPFRAVNLHAVDLSIIRIFEHNVLTFLQANDLESSNELRRCGRLVYKKTLWLGRDKSKDLHRWEDYSVDLGRLIRQEPGAIYRVILSFRQEYSAYPCSGNAASDVSYAQADLSSVDALRRTDGSLSVSEEEEAEWDIPQAYYYYTGGQSVDWRLYDWKERDNPCHPSYYMNTSRVAACNVMASDIGLTVKGNSLNTLWVAVNRVTTTQPVGGAKVTAYNYQLQPLGEVTTGRDGFAEMSVSGKPFIVVAESEGNRTYVRVPEGEALSVSRFDVGGKETQKGLKGFVYGERGVWRPGDTLHVAFMLEDRSRRIPDKHPVALELYNSRGQFYDKQISVDGQHGLYVFHVPTKAEDPTGIWNAYVKVGGATFHKSLRIETIKPNRLKIDLRLPDKTLQADGPPLPVHLSSAWLTGAVASGLKTKVELSLSKVNTQFPGYSAYVFNNPATDFTSMKSTVFEGVLDGNGRQMFNLNAPKALNAPGMLNALFTTRVFEPGGDASFHTLSVPYSPFEAYVGINLHQSEDKYLETDQEHVFDVVTLNAKGQPVDRKDLEYSVYRIDWNWWWENKAESFASYLNSNAVVPLLRGKLQTVSGKARFSFRVDYPDWGRYLVYVKDRTGGHAAGGVVYIDWPEWRGRSAKIMPDGVTMLSFSLDKDSYEIGEEATAVIPAAGGGRALVSIENGTTVLKREWIEMEEGKDAKYCFRITPDMAPNVYLHVCLLQPHSQTVNDLPIRMYGVKPVSVISRETVLHPQIDLPDVLRPETDFQVSVREKNGKPMTYTLAVVDEGLLDLTNFKTPDPWNEFYAREALGIRTWDMYDHVLGATAGMYAPLFSTGGDEMLKPADAKANRFKPVVKYIGPFTLDKGKTNVHSLRLPMYVGSVRVMVVAGQDGAYGNAERTASVRAPLMLLSSLPRVMGTQEEITVPVNVFALERTVTKVQLSMQVSDGLKVVDDARLSLNFKEPGDSLVYFRLMTGNVTGKATVTLTAYGGGQQAKEKIEIDIRNPNPAVTLTESRWLEKDGHVNLKSPSVAQSLNDVRWSMEVARIPSLGFVRQMDFLAGYEHLCTEQLTSKALPLLFAADFKEMSQTENERMRIGVEDGIRSLYARQLPNGGFGYWPGNAVADEWVTSYAGMFLVLAQEKGYAVSRQVVDKWMDYQRLAARDWRMPEGQPSAVCYTSAQQQAYRLYVLALAGMAEQGAMNRMKERKDLPVQALWWLSCAYSLIGKSQTANELIYQAQAGQWTHDSACMLYGSPERDEAVILEALSLAGRTQEALSQARKLSQSFASRRWLDTQSSAFAWMALSRLAREQSGTLHFSWACKGEEQEVNSAKTVFVAELPSGAENVTVRNQADGALHVLLSARVQLLKDTLPAISDGLRLEVKYTDLSGRPVNVASLAQGTDLLAVVSVVNLSSTTDYSDLALTYVLPSGWEVYNERLFGSGVSSDASRQYVYQDVRDDRVLTYFGLSRGARKRFTFRLQATYMGRFVLPAVQCESMYQASVRARTKAGKVIVTR